MRILKYDLPGPGIALAAIIGIIAAFFWDEIVSPGGSYLLALLCPSLLVASWQGISQRSSRAALETLIVAAAITCAVGFASIWLLFELLTI